jgi:hypothetical protein
MNYHFTPADFVELLGRELQWFELLMRVTTHRSDHLSRGEDIFAHEIHRVIAEMLHAHVRQLRN